MDWLALLIVVALAPLPLVEVRLSIVLGVVRYHLGGPLTFLLVTAANLLFIPVAWALLPPVERLCRRSALLDRLLTRLFAKTRKDVRHWRQVLEEVGMFAIVALLAVPFPLPGSGIYTALVAAYVFGFPLRKVFPWIAAGVVVAAGAFTLLTVGSKAAFRW